MSTENNRAEIIPAIQPVTTIRQIVRVIRALGMRYKPVAFGVDKRQGVSIDRERKSANKAALMLLNSLQDGDKLTDEQRKTLAGYTGEGGIGGSEYEYYTPQPVAEGIWDLWLHMVWLVELGLNRRPALVYFKKRSPPV